MAKRAAVEPVPVKFVEFVFGQEVEELGEDGATFVHKVKTEGMREATLKESSQN